MATGPATIARFETAYTEVPSRSRRSVVATTATALGIGLAGCSSLLDGTGETTDTSTEPTETATGREAETPGTASDVSSVAGLSVAATDTDYAIMSVSDARTTATLYGEWKCPYTKEFIILGPHRAHTVV